ncbi:HNH endonuclease [Sorangium sp. So ce1097]|uniref:HNH endonuclease n=1 Tax=Sorangium sp. So ce1097 TaxID=3133330 RepID=UPI003F60CF94
MAYDDEKLSRIFSRTNDRCHLCGDALTFSHYGHITHRGGWEVDHDVPRALGGGDDEENLLPAHVSCNRSKQALPSELVRSIYGLSQRPMSEGERAAAQVQQSVGFGLLGALGGSALGAVLEPRDRDPSGAMLALGAVGGIFGMLLGAALDPE